MAARVLHEIDQFMRTVARFPASVLMLDYDGTLAPFVVDRERAVPYPGVSEILQQILDTGRTRIVIITGRDAHEVNALLGVSPVPEVWGSHGLQRLRLDGVCELPDLDPIALQGLNDAERWLSYQGLHHLVEQKPGGLAVHWRSLDEPAVAELRARILLGWFPIADRAALAVFEFDGGVELRIDDRDKSDAIGTIVRETRPDTPIAYLGDDMTDERAFRALEGRGLTVLVRPERRRTAARVWLKPPEELLEFLTRWRDACRTTRLAQSAS